MDLKHINSIHLLTKNENIFCGKVFRKARYYYFSIIFTISLLFASKINFESSSLSIRRNLG